MKHLVKIAILIFLFISNLWANEGVKNLANTIATPFYNVYNENVKELLAIYTKKNKNIYAIKLYDSLLDKTSIVYYKKNGKFIFELDKEFPRNYELPIYTYTQEIVKDSKKIGIITVYSNINLNIVNKYITFTKEEKEYLNKKDFITMCVDPDWEPYEQINKDGKHIGLAADFIKLVEKKIDKKFLLVPTQTWSQSLDYLKDGKCEILSFLNKTPKRDKFLNFTSILYEEPAVIVARNKVTYLDGLDSLEGKIVGVVKGYIIDEYLQENYPKINIKYMKNYEDGFNMIEDGKIYASINSLLGIGYLIRKNNLLNIKIAGKTNIKDLYRIGINKDDAILHSVLSKAVNSITKQDKDKILSNWISIKFEQKVDYELIINIVLFFLVIIVALSYRQYVIRQINNKLRKQMEEQLEEIVAKDRILFQQTRLAQMGEMISMIAHQWRQPLGSISSAVVAVDMSLKVKYNLEDKNSAQEFKKFLDEKNKNILKYVNFLSQTIDDFRTFFKPDKQKELVSIVEPIQSSLQIISDSLKNNGIELILDFQTEEKIELHKNEMIQVILNILKNSEDNFKEKNIDKPKITIKTIKEKDNLVITICDNGGGIKDDIINNIFDPYFSTKTEKNGTGLGLYMSKIIVEEHNNGRLTVSNTKKGACFKILFNIK